MTFEELLTEFQGRGFDYLSTSKSGGYLNDAYLVDVCEAEDWPFLEATTSGTAPLTISDLRSVEYVVDGTTERKLSPLDRRLLTDAHPVLTETGSALRYFLTNGTTINVQPLSTDTLAVRYYKTPPKLSGSNSPLLPERFHSLIIDGAVARAYEDSDDWELAQSAEAKFQIRLEKMRGALLDPYRDGPSEYMQMTDAFPMA